MNTPAITAIIDDLKRQFPGWDIWCTPCYIPPDRWSAKRTGEDTASLQTRSPEDLAAMLARADTGQS